MLPVERQQKILDYVKARGAISIAELATLLSVSHMTVRRDLRNLEQDGMVVSVSGGVQVTKKLLNEPSRIIKSEHAVAEKDRIGCCAASMVAENSCIYLDAGTTSLAVARYISNRKDLTVVTNDFAILNYLSEKGMCNVIHTGGQLRPQNMSAVGILAARTLDSLSLDIAFLSASSWDSRGITTPDVEKVPVKQAAVRAAKQRVLICDASKYGQIATYVAFPLDALNTAICDSSLPESAGEALKAHHIEVRIV